MALVKCKECGEQVSTSAQSCPKCGAKPPKRTPIIVPAILIIVVLAAVFGTNRDPAPEASLPTETAEASASASPSPTPPPALKPNWVTSTSVDKMTGRREVYATSITIPPTEQMAFPYGDVKAWLGIGCNGKDEWAYIGFSDSPNLTNTDTKDGYNTLSARIKWNDSVENVPLSQEWGSAFLHFGDYDQAIQKISGATSALLELKWYGQNNTYFDFPMVGSAAAIADMRKQCSAIQ
ncbi:MAG: zinc ribbon domain-containing protein [Proteobacteria bacterium]|nr:zinc ribbon domain-containing protein [Pseudomonadota bacterium]